MYACFEANHMHRETEMYLPVKQFLETLGYEVKSEIKNCDVVAYKLNTPPIIIELKKNLSFELIFQGIKRLAITDNVYIAISIREKCSKNVLWKKRRNELLNLLKRIGLGLLLVDIRSSRVEIFTEPSPYKPRKVKKQLTQLTTEFNRRIGDPNAGGSTRVKIMTAYRQDALRCAFVLVKFGPLSLKEIRKNTLVEKAGSILQKNFYGWFIRVEKGVYTISNKGIDAIKSNKKTLNYLNFKY